LYIILGIKETPIIMPKIVIPTGSNTPKFEVIAVVKGVNIRAVSVNIIFPLS